MPTGVLVQTELFKNFYRFRMLYHFSQRIHGPSGYLHHLRSYMYFSILELLKYVSLLCPFVNKHFKIMPALEHIISMYNNITIVQKTCRFSPERKNAGSHHPQKHAGSHQPQFHFMATNLH